MDSIRTYLLKLTAAAVLCGIISAFFGKKGGLTVVFRLLTGIFMMLTIVSPWVGLRIVEFASYFENISYQSDDIVAQGENMARDSLSNIIKEKTEAYILDKANSFGAELTVEVSVEGSEWPVPVAVRVSGSISPYGKKQMEAYISQELEIALEDQIWIG